MQQSRISSTLLCFRFTSFYLLYIVILQLVCFVLPIKFSSIPFYSVLSTKRYLKLTAYKFTVHQLQTLSLFFSCFPCPFLAAVLMCNINLYVKLCFWPPPLPTVLLQSSFYGLFCLCFFFFTFTSDYDFSVGFT